MEPRTATLGPGPASALDTPAADSRAVLLTILLTVSLAFAGCAPAPPPADVGPGRDEVMNEVAEAYVKLVLALGQHDADFVDAYHGPEDWRPPEGEDPLPLPNLRRQAEALLGRLAGVEPDDFTAELERLRHHYLTAQLGAVVARIDMLSGESFTFDEEAAALYNAEVPFHPDSYFERLHLDLEQHLPGRGPLAERMEAFRRRFVIPPEKLDAVFEAAIEACRERTLAHLELPEGESFRVEYVTDKPWSGYNWYQGEYRSLIQVNTDLPIFIDRAVDLACHEGYPGHHVYNVLLEKHLLEEKGWMEFSVYALFSPQSLIAEGSANYGIEVAFPGEERLAFERDVLFPLAGLNPAEAETYARVRGLLEGLAYADNEAARRYLDGELDAGETAAWLVTHALSSPERAAQRVRFIDKYRAYVINYNLGQDLVRAFVEKHGGPSAERRWQVFELLLASPRLPSGLR